jgi:methylenetetrahydrofolate--tRNA-(uracil-5-)-methyltransferase
MEMRPVQKTPAHQTADLAELVCTNSFKSEDLTNAHGLLKAEMRDMGSILLDAAHEAKVPAGTALAVDRTRFANAVTQRIANHPNIEIVREEMTSLPDSPTVIATGPLTSDALTKEIKALLGDTGLAFYDSIAPIIAGDSINHEVAFYASRWGKGEGDDYINCPMTREEYEAFIASLRESDVYPGHEWENIPYFEGCLPIEVAASRGDDTLRFGPMKPIGLRDPRNDKRPYAVVQLRREDGDGRMWNMVGFQTRLRTGEQKKVFRMIPGLENAEFLRTGSIHRNTYLNFPSALTSYGAPHARRDVIFAGQLTGVEGYMESAANGILAGVNLHRIATKQEPAIPPSTTMLGGLMRYLREASPGRFQPMNSNFGLLDSMEGRIRNKDERRSRMIERAREDFARWWHDANEDATAVKDAGAATLTSHTKNA